MKQFGFALLFAALGSFAVADSAFAVGDGPGLVNVGTGQIGPPVATPPSAPPSGGNPDAGIYDPALGTFTPHQMGGDGVPGWWVWTNKDGVNQWSFVRDPHMLGRKEWNGGGNSASGNGQPANSGTNPPEGECVPASIVCGVCKQSTLIGDTSFAQVCSDGCQSYTQACLQNAPTLTFTGSYGDAVDQTSLDLPSGGGRVELRWSTTDAKPGICEASWVGGDKETSGASGQSVTATKTFTLECWNTSVSPRVSTGQKSVVVTVTDAAATGTVGTDTSGCSPTYSPCTSSSNSCGMASVGILNSCTNICSARTPSNGLCAR